jgi:hypothetical protein
MIKRILRAIFNDEFERHQYELEKLNDQIDTYRARNRQLESENDLLQGRDLEFRCLRHYVASDDEYTEIMETAAKVERLEQAERAARDIKDGYLKSDVDSALEAAYRDTKAVNRDDLPGYLIAVKKLEHDIKNIEEVKLSDSMAKAARIKREAELDMLVSNFRNPLSGFGAQQGVLGAALGGR